MERSQRRPAEQQLGFNFPDVTEKPRQDLDYLPTGKPPPHSDTDFPYDLDITPLEEANPQNSILLMIKLC